MPTPLWILPIAAAGLLLIGCGSAPTQNQCTSIAPCNGNLVTSPLDKSDEVNHLEIIDVVPRPPIIINATGYAAPISNKKFSAAQARLLSLRGSKLDAYRNLTERVYGLKVNGSSNLSNMMTQNDELRTFVDAYLVGAKVVSQRELEDGSFETIVEMALQENFRQCVSSPENLKANPACQIRPTYRTVNSEAMNDKTTNFYAVE